MTSDYNLPPSEKDIKRYNKFKEAVIANPSWSSVKIAKAIGVNNGSITTARKRHGDHDTFSVARKKILAGAPPATETKRKYTKRSQKRAPPQTIVINETVGDTGKIIFAMVPINQVTEFIQSLK